MSELEGWSGRVDQPEDASTRRWHQWVRAVDAGAAPGVALLGFACDEGVRRNHGRLGAKDGPAALRKMLSNLPTLDDTPLYEAGTVNCDDGDLEVVKSSLGMCCPNDSAGAEYSLSIPIHSLSAPLLHTTNTHTVESTHLSE